ncbi:MAG: hypothetical protein R3F27_10925 [Gammaproteobacteria bacterium]
MALLTVGWIPGTGRRGRSSWRWRQAGGSALPAFIALAVMLIWCTGLGAIWAFVKLIGTSAGIEPPGSALRSASRPAWQPSGR